MERQAESVNDSTAITSTPPPTALPPAPPTPEERSSRGDLIIAVILAIIAIAVIRYLNVFSFLKVLLGLSFVIFIHEFGHFIVAKMCDVHVTHFSIGFGPVIPGCWFKWGETTYQICLLPLGGYVQMVGQVDGDESSDGSENDPRSYRNKSVPKRMAIISAGVIMNVILALIIFILVYRIPGKERLAARIGDVDSTGPAFRYGMCTGMDILEINDDKKPFFEDLRVAVGSSSAGEKIRLLTTFPGQPQPIAMEIEPRKLKSDANPVLGVTNAFTTRFFTNKEVAPDTIKHPVQKGSAADAATPPFELGDSILGTSDPADPSKVTDLPEDPQQKDQKDVFEFLRRMQLLADKEVTFKVQREAGNIVEIKVPAGYHTSLGATMEMGQIVALRKDSPAMKVNILLPRTVDTGKKEGDLIEGVEVKDAAGKVRVFAKETLDPERLPVELKKWARELAAAGKIKDASVTLHVRRHRDKGGEDYEHLKIDVPWDNVWAFDRSMPMSPHSAVAIPELGLAYSVRPTVARVADAASALKSGDTIKSVRISYHDAEGKEKTSSWEDVAADSWAYIGVSLLQGPSVITKVQLKVERDKKVEEIEIAPGLDKNWPRTLRGWLLLPDTRIQRADTTFEAITFGIRDTHRMMIGILNGIRQMLVGRIDFTKQLGGPLSIMNMAYGYAGRDFWEFVFFLGLISVNLAVINFLPIPLLDGGHMVFLIYEAIRGKPASEGVRIAATYLGLAFIACLILLVTYLDIGRWF